MEIQLNELLSLFLLLSVKFFVSAVEIDIFFDVVLSDYNFFNFFCLLISYGIISLMESYTLALLQGEGDKKK